MGRPNGKPHRLSAPTMVRQSGPTANVSPGKIRVYASLMPRIGLWERSCPTASFALAHPAARRRAFRHRVSMVSFELDNLPTPQVGQLLDKEGIAVRAGHHCAQPALRALGYEMSVRPSFAFYNTKEEIDKLVQAPQKNT